MLLDSLRTAARGLRRQPAFVTVVVLSLALGIALNTTMYGMLDALLRPRIDVRDPGQLYWIRFYGDYKGRVDNPTRDAVLSSGTHTYESVTRSELAIFAQQIQHDGHLAEGVVQAVAWNYFDVLGARPVAGRTFITSDETPDVGAIVIDETVAAQLFPDGGSPVGATGNAVTVADAGGVREFPAPLFAPTAVSPSYVRTMGWPIVQGRDFLDGERDHAGLIIDGSTARKLWPNNNPIGALLKLGDKKSNLPYIPVVGVIGEQKGFEMPGDQSQTGARLGGVFYLPGPKDTAIAKRSLFLLTLRARAADHPERLPTILRQQIASFPDASVSQVMTMVDYLGVTTGLQGARFLSELFVAFAALAIALAGFGVYGVVAHGVAERRRELGVRVALGATTRDILHAVLRESVVVALAGAAGGLFLTKRGVLLVSEIAMLDVYNAPLFAIVAVVVLCVATATAFIPAMRATRIDPTESLRAE